MLGVLQSRAWTKDWAHALEPCSACLLAADRKCPIAANTSFHGRVVGACCCRNTFELPEVGAGSANPLALTALSKKQQRKARQALESAQKAIAPSDQPRTIKR